jgi:LAS superfamily LD-carboxypeptidase LdcB
LHFFSFIVVVLFLFFFHFVNSQFKITSFSCTNTKVSVRSIHSSIFFDEEGKKKKEKKQKRAQEKQKTKKEGARKERKPLQGNIEVGASYQQKHKGFTRARQRGRKRNTLSASQGITMPRRADKLRIPLVGGVYHYHMILRITPNFAPT